MNEEEKAVVRQQMEKIVDSQQNLAEELHQINLNLACIHRALSDMAVLSSKVATQVKLYNDLYILDAEDESKKKKKKKKKK